MAMSYTVCLSVCMSTSRDYCLNSDLCVTFTADVLIAIVVCPTHSLSKCHYVGLGLVLDAGSIRPVTYSCRWFWTRIVCSTERCV